MRRHETFERDLVALENRVEDITKNADLLSQVYEENAEGIAEQQATVIEAWEQLTASCSARKQRLNDSLELHRFLSDTRDLVRRNLKFFVLQRISLRASRCRG